MSNIYQNFISRKRTIICLGAGGVGKTTMSIAMAVIAAKEGKKVGLLSIDPAKRLAAALGISLGSELRKISLPETKFATGEVHAAMLDQKVVFDDIVRRFTTDKSTQEKIMNNTLYKAASSGFGGALEYMALAKLQRMVESEDYDLVVLDTPPDSHALDFLSRPDVLSGFMESKVMTWLIKPIHLARKVGLSKLVTIGEKIAGGIASVTGVRALQVLAEFLVLMQDVIEGLNKAGGQIVKLLHEEDTGFILITTLKSSPVRSAANMIQELKAQEYNLDYVLVNRCLPPDVAESISHLDQIKDGLGVSKNCLQAVHNSYAVSETLKKKLNDSLISELGHLPPMQYFPEQPDNLQTIDAVIALAEALNR